MPTKLMSAIACCRLVHGFTSRLSVCVRDLVHLSHLSFPYFSTLGIDRNIVAQVGSEEVDVGLSWSPGPQHSALFFLSALSMFILNCSERLFIQCLCIGLFCYKLSLTDCFQAGFCATRVVFWTPGWPQEATTATTLANSRVRATWPGHAVVVVHGVVIACFITLPPVTPAAAVAGQPTRLPVVVTQVSIATNIPHTNTADRDTLDTNTPPPHQWQKYTKLPGEKITCRNTRGPLASSNTRHRKHKIVEVVGKL